MLKRSACRSWLLLGIAGGLMGAAALSHWASAQQPAPNFGMPQVHDPGVRGGSPGAGGPLPGLDSAELAFDFEAVDAEEEFGGWYNGLTDLRGAEHAVEALDMPHCAGKENAETIRRAQSRYSRALELVSRKYALIETPGREFTLVPWRPVVEHELDRNITGIMHGDGISWELGRSRTLGIGL